MTTLNGLPRTWDSFIQGICARKKLVKFSRLCGPMSSNSLRGYAYYVSFIDDFSRKTWVYFMKNKDEVFSKFKEFKALNENHTKKKIKTF